MKIVATILLFLSLPAHSTIVGITTHPLAREAQVLSAEMTGYMSQRNEMGAGARYTQGFDNRLLDIYLSGAQESRSMSYGAGLDFQVLSEELNRPRISIKPGFRQLTFESESATQVGAAPSIRKGVAVAGYEVFPFLSLPNGIQVESKEQELDFYSALSFGASMVIPDSQQRLVVSLEANKDLGNSSDSVGALVSWIWK